MISFKPEEIDYIRSVYPPGTEVELYRMDDPRKFPPGARSVVESVDDAGQIHVRWENGSRIILVYGEDRFVKVN